MRLTKLILVCTILFTLRAAYALELVTSEPTTLPEVSYETLDGQPARLADFGADALVVNFWATWCAPCVKEMPSLDRLQAALAGDGVEVVAITVDRPSVDADEIRSFLAELGIENLKVLRTSLKELRALEIPGLPSTLVLDGEGRQVARWFGQAEWDSEDAIAAVRAVAAGAS